MWSTLVCRRDLRLVDLDDAGLTDLGTTRDELVLSGRLDYPVTRQWSLALWHAVPWADGLLWDSRQNRGSAALMLFEKRDDRAGGVERLEHTVGNEPPVPGERSATGQQAGTARRGSQMGPGPRSDVRRDR